MKRHELTSQADTDVYGLRRRQPRNPETPAEWQDAVNHAEALLLIDSARQYGLLTGGPVVAVERCLKILERARELRIVPQHDVVLAIGCAWADPQTVRAAFTSRRSAP